MKRVHLSGLAVVFPTVFFVLLSGCGPPTKTEAPKPVRILEIESDSKGNMDVRGKALYFRLSNDGTAEFEFLTGKTTEKNRVEDVNVPIRVVLGEKEKDKLIGTLKTLINTSFDSEYRRKCCCTDTQVDFRVMIEIDGEQKSTTLAGFCDSGDVFREQAQPKHNIPAEMVMLFSTVDNLRWKYKKAAN